MSLILDALRKADTERRLGEVPRLDAQPMTPSPLRGNTRRIGSWWIASLTLVLAMLAAAGYAWKVQRASPPSADASPSAGATPPVSAQAPEASSHLPAAPQAASVRDIDPAPPNREKPPRAQPAPLLAGMHTPDTLPQRIRAELPPLRISGSIHSPLAADRIVIINGLVLREHDQVAPGLVLEEIRPASVVLLYKGYRFEQSL